jgi:predicted transcriptional regulator YheO
VNHPLEEAIGPLVRAIGASMVPVQHAMASDVVLHWEGAPAVAVRVDINDALAGLISSVESELGGTLGTLDRTGKQAAIRILDERGAFVIRKAIEDVADAMGVSRITIYNYLNAIRDRTDAPGGEDR